MTTTPVSLPLAHSPRRSLQASLLVGFVDTFGKVFFAQYSGISVYVLMALILIWRPEGLKSKGY